MPTTMNEWGEGSLREAIIGGKEYKVYSDESGRAVKASRYNEKHKTVIDITFAAENDAKSGAEARNLLKSLYLSRIHAR